MSSKSQAFSIIYRVAFESAWCPPKGHTHLNKQFYLSICDLLVNTRDLRVKKSYVTQPAITCSKLTTETIEQGVKYVQS